MADLGQKLSFLMEHYGITNTALGGFIPVDRSTVSKWRSGRLFCSRSAYGSKIAEYFVQTVGRKRLADIFGSSSIKQPEDDGDFIGLLEAFLFDGGDIRLPEKEKSPAILGRRVKNEGCFLGVEGLFDALSLLAATLDGESDETSVHIYLSSEYCGLLLDARTDALWEDLYILNQRRSVKVIMEQGRESGRAAQILRRLTPFIMAGKLELSCIPSAERYFCYHISFLAEGRCMVMTTEPAGGAGICVSLFVDSPEFVLPMGRVLKKLDKIARPMARFISAKTETAVINSFLEEDGELHSLFDGLNLLYATPESLTRILKARSVPYKRAWNYVQRFTRQKADFERLLPEGGYTELVLLDAVDELIASKNIRPCEMSFPAGDGAPTGLSFLREALEGMVEYLGRYRQLQIVLVRDGTYRDLAWRIKGGRSILLHTLGGENPRGILSDNRLFIEQYEDALITALRAKSTIRGRANVISALKKRIDKISGMEG